MTAKGIFGTSCAVKGILSILLLVCWIINLIKFCQCDFNPPLKTEVIHGVGVFLPPTALVTVWFGTQDEITTPK